MPGVRWGNTMEHATPAHRVRNLLTQRLEPRRGGMRLSSSLAQIVGHVLIDRDGSGQGHYVREAAYLRLDAMGAFGSVAPTAAQLREWLATPLALRNRLTETYALSDESAGMWSNVLEAVVRAPTGTDAPTLRDWLANIPGLNKVTASFAVKHLLEPHNVAVIDPYALQNGQLMGLFSLDADLERDYPALEMRLLALCSKLSIDPGEFYWGLRLDGAEHRREVARRVEALHADARQRVAGKNRADKAPRPVTRRGPRSELNSGHSS